MRKVNRPNNEILGCWNAYVASGKTSNIRKARLEETPEHLKEQVWRHCVTVYRLRGGK